MVEKLVRLLNQYNQANEQLINAVRELELFFTQYQKGTEKILSSEDAVNELVRLLGQSETSDGCVKMFIDRLCDAEATACELEEVRTELKGLQARYKKASDKISQDGRMITNLKKENEDLRRKLSV